MTASCTDRHEIQFSYRNGNVARFNSHVRSRTAETLEITVPFLNDDAVGLQIPYRQDEFWQNFLGVRF